MSKKNKLSRTMYYHRFNWEEIGDDALPTQSLQETLTNILSSKKSTKARKVSWDNTEGYIAKAIKNKIANNKLNQKEVLCIHLVMYEPLSKTNTVPIPSELLDVDIDAVPPPKEQNWMDGGACMLISDNDIISCPCTMGNSVAFKYLKLLIANNTQINPSCMRFMPTANEDKIKLINKEGVDHINLNLSLYSASIEYEKQNNKKLKNQFTHQIKSIIDAILSQNKDKDKDIKELANMKVGLTFNLNTKEKDISSKQLSELGSILVSDEEEGYSIKTLSGNTITYNDLKIKKPIKLDRNGKTMDRSSAWKELINYYTDLEKNGIITK